MFFKQFYLGCLAQASYMIGSDGVAVVVDPQRDVDLYLAEAESQGLTIRYVLETHLHADFVSGHVELAERTGAEIWIGASAGAEFAHVPVSEGDEIRLGGEGVALRALETPGHTPESISWLVYDHSISDQPLKLLTGDTLFIGDVGRPDLVGSRGFTAAQMAGMMFDSLHEKILTLPDEVEVYPAHGAGSACGRNISSERSSTIGIQRRTNYALQITSREEFVETMSTNLAPAPAYFPIDAEINRRGAGKLDDLELHPLDATRVQQLQSGGALILDVRSPRSYGAEHIPGSTNIGLGGQYASWAGTLLDVATPLVIVADDEIRAREARMRLARVGMENVEGWLAEGIPGWKAAGGETASIAQVSVSELNERLRSGEPLHVLDVRRTGEYGAGHVPGAVNIPLDELGGRTGQLDGDLPMYVVCEGGYRSSIATSILERQGLTRLSNVTGGTSAWRKASYEMA